MVSLSILGRDGGGLLLATTALTQQTNQIKSNHIYAGKHFSQQVTERRRLQPTNDYALLLGRLLGLLALTLALALGLLALASLSGRTTCATPQKQQPTTTHKTKTN